MKRFPMLRFAGRKKVLIAVCTAGVAALLAFSCSRAPSSAAQKKLIVLGIDGMDPLLLRQWMDEGKMPNFKSLATRGSFLPLQTSIPPQSPVAWSNLITGMNPGGHAIFDFIHRDPATMTPYFSTSQVKPPKHNLHLGSWMIPLSEGEVLLLRQGKAFWQYLDEQKIPLTVFRIPSNFPPVENKGKTLAGMGTPDLLGGYGTFSFHTDDPVFTPGPVNGGVIYPVQVAGDHIEGQIHGPANSLRKDHAEVLVPFAVDRDPVEAVARFSVQEHMFILREHEWSSWMPINFKLIPGLESITGICRFYLKQVRPQFELYITPLNIDPSNPALPISTPKNYAPELARDEGYFYTQGIAEDTKALTSGLLNDDEYLQQARTVFEEHHRLFQHELARYKAGLFFFYFSSLDLNQHMFWRAMDPKSASYDAELGAKHGKVLEDYYREMDGILGEALRVADENTTVLVVSDHGFAPFRRSFNLNTWLVENGYLVLRAGIAPHAGRDIFRDVDWSRTRAYGLGLNGLYVNLRGREKNGIVGSGAESDGLQREIAAKLLAVRDPVDQQQVITRVDRAAEAYAGPAVSQAPDLIVGYNRGFRVGWDSVLGGISAAVMEDNTQPWSGDHCMDYTKVPGVVLSNRKIQADAPFLTDIAPTILAEFGIAKPAEMHGHTIFEKSGAKPETRAMISDATKGAARVAASQSDPSQGNATRQQEKQP
jgi:predicted AlkP superfamily phosphohydrolase/phosphomutase